MNRLRYLVLICLVAAGSLHAQYIPSWWSAPQTSIFAAGASPSNHGVANLAQLKWVAFQAKKHLDAKLPGGAGPAINAMVAAFKPQTGVTYTAAELEQIRRDNYAPATLGQLKAIALPFYDRLMNAGYNTNLNLKANGYLYNWAFNYPWNPSTPAASNYVLVGIGQLKLVFSFDLVDSDQNGTLDYLEGFYPAANPFRDTDGDGVLDAYDMLPDDPFQAVQLVSDPNDHTAPTITILQPAGYVLQP